LASSSTQNPKKSGGEAKYQADLKPELNLPDLLDMFEELEKSKEELKWGVTRYQRGDRW
jgi:hypothetical protein